MKKNLMFLLFLLMSLATIASAYVSPAPARLNYLQVTNGFGRSAIQIVSPNSGSTVNVVPTLSILLIDPAATLATVNVTLVSTNAYVDCFDGQGFKILSSQAVTYLNLTSTSTLKGTTPTSLTAGTGVNYFWKKSNDTFYRE